jgi:hypothetical protein
VVFLGHKTGDITSHYSAPEVAELIRAANAVLKTQESTLLRVVTKQLQVVNGEKSRNSRAERKTGRSFAPNPFALPESWVTVYSGDMGNTSGLCGSAKCLGRSVAKWMNLSDS